MSRQHRALVLAIWAVWVLLAGVVISRTPFVADLSAFLPAKPDAQQQVLVDQLQSGVAARTLLMGIDGGTAQQRAQASIALAQNLRASGHFEQVQNGENDGFAAAGKWLLNHRYLISPAIEPARFTATGLRDAIDETLSLLGTPAGNAIKPLLERDPTGETQRIAESLLPAHAPKMEEGVWVSRSGPRAVLLANVAAAGADLDAQAAAIGHIRQAFLPIAQAVVSNASAASAASAASTATPTDGAVAPAEAALQLHISGAPIFSVESRARIESEVRTLAITGTVLISALLLLAFASVPALLVALLPVAVGVLTGIAAVGLGFGTVHGVTLGFGTTLVGEAVDYAIYYLIQARSGAVVNGPHQRVGWRHWVQGSWPTVRLGLLTSVCGFAALAFSGFSGLAQLGVFSTAGLVGAALTTRFLLPVLMPNGASGDGARRWLGRGARAAVAVLPRFRNAFLGLGALAAAGLLWQGKAVWSADLASLSPISASAMALEESLRADLTASEGGTLVVVQAENMEAALVQAEAVAARLDNLVNSGQLAGYNSVTRWLPSRATQARRLAALPDETTLQAALITATAGGPLNAQRLRPFVAEVQTARALQPVSVADVKGTALAPLVDALLVQRKDGRVSTLLPVQFANPQLNRADPSSATQNTLQNSQSLRTALADLPGVQLLDIKPELDRLYSRYLSEAQTQTLLGAAAVVVLMGLWLRSAKRLLAVCQPLLLAVVLTVAGLALFQVPLGILHLVGLLLVVAVGSNYALFFDLVQHGPSSAAAQADPLADDTLPSLLLANLTTVLSFGLIALSSIPALSSIGQVVAPGALLALVLAAAFAPVTSHPPSLT